MTNKRKRHIAILGSTGSIGTQALDVIRSNRDKFEVEVLTAQDNADLLIKQAIEFLPNCVVITNEKQYDKVFSILDPVGVKVYSGEKSLASVVQMETIDMVLTALMGYSGLLPTIKAIEAGKHIALANKETLVVAGELITKLANEKRVFILPVDSEHSAIFQCLSGEEGNPVEKIILTASGGPFRGKKAEQLKYVTKADALKHPNWSMGAKITIDSASMMNKGLEVIEAKWLFNLNASQIEVVIHPQSIIHSMVQFLDGSIKAQLGLPDMKLPIQYALAFPKRLKSDFPRMNFRDFNSLTFEEPDTETFRNLKLAYHAMEKGGNVPCIMNAANEIAVQEFLNDNVSFLEIPEIIEECMVKVPFIAKPSYEDYVKTDKETRKIAQERLKL
ncbi:MAG: 1-deoxy-D-xylulose-5-phosphate reductoisomerase [Cytophagaceae bacterium]|nr:1-deoxy-D-xylulose-5-phosphate reductoisomerase [Cytophagaceae bacterium]